MDSSIKADVAIIGAGTAGVMAAVSAAREGLRVVLAEKTELIGGVAATTLMGSFTNLTVNTKGRQLIGGIIVELIKRLVEEGGTPYHSLDEALNGTIGAPFTIPFKPPYYSKVLMDMLCESNVILLLDTVFIGGEQVNDESILHFCAAGAPIEICAKVVIDASGNAAAAAALGAQVLSKPYSHGSLMKIGGVDMQKAFDYVKKEQPWLPDASYEGWLRTKLGLSPDETIKQCSHLLDPLSYDHSPMAGNGDTALTPKRFSYIEKRWEKEGIFYTLELNLFRKLIRQATDNGDFILDCKLGDNRGITFNGDGLAFGAWGDGVALCNVAKPYGFHSQLVEEQTRAVIEAFRYNFMMLHFFKKYIPGFENSFLLEMGSQTISRADRMIVGCEREDDKKALYREPIYMFGGIYEFQQGVAVTYGKIVCKNIDNVFAVGKCSSNGGQYRAQISCMAQGVAAAAAAKIVVSQNYTSHSIPCAALRRQLNKMGVILNKEPNDA